MDLNIITITPQDTEKLLAAGNGAAALLYLYVHSTGDHRLLHAKERLHLPTEELAYAESLLGRLGLLERKTAALRFEKDRAPVYSGEQVASYCARDPGFSLLQGEISRRLGRILTSEELKCLLGIRDYLKLPPEVISVALSYCLERTDYLNRTHGTNRRMSFRTFERTCYDWANRGLDNLAAASSFVAEEQKKRSPIGQVKKVLHLDLPLVDSQKAYIESWLGMGFSPEVIAVAYDRTVLSTGKLVWRYMNRILENWHQQGLHTLAEVQSGDKKQPAQPAPQNPTYTPGQSELNAIAQLQRLRDSMKEE